MNQAIAFAVIAALGVGLAYWRSRRNERRGERLFSPTRKPWLP